MEQTNMVLAMYQAMAAQGMVPKTGKTDGKSGDFQKLLDQKSQSQSQPAKSDAPVEGKPKADAANQKVDGTVQEEDPIEKAKKLQVYLAPLTAEELSQYPAAWLPQVEEGEPIVCIGVRAGANGEDIPILVGAKQAAQMYGKPVVDPALYDVSDPEADAMLEATDPTVEHSHVELLDKALDHQAGKAVEQTAEEVKPQEKDEDAQVELIDVEQGPRQIFHDVKAAPIKVGEAPELEQPQNVAQQIDTGLAQALQKGESLVRIQLTPANLGEVTVEISQSAQGVLKVALTASSADTRELLQRHAGDLQGMLNSRTQQSVEVSVQRQQESQQNQNQQHSYDGHNGHAQDGQERRRQQREHTSPEDFMQQLRLGLIPDDGGI